MSRVRFHACFRCYAARMPPDLLGQIRWCWVFLLLTVHGVALGWRLSSKSSNKTHLWRGCGGCLLPPSLADRGGGGRREGGGFLPPARRPMAPLPPASSHDVWRRSSSCSEETPWWGVWAVGDVDGRSPNKCDAATFSGGPLLLLLPPVGQGGEGWWKRSRDALGPDGWRGCFSTAASRRGAGRSPLRCLDMLPWWKLFEPLELENPIPFERCCSLSGSSALPIHFLAGLGGEGEVVGVGALALLWQWIKGPAAEVSMASWCSGWSASLMLPASPKDQQLPRGSATPFATPPDFCRRLRTAAPRKGSSSYTADQLRIAIQVVLAFFLSLGWIHRQQLRSSLMSLPRFSGEDPPTLSSVVCIPYLQLNFLPRWTLPSQLLVEPLALWSASLLEALEDHSCMFISSMFSTDPLTGSGYVLRRRQLVLQVVPFFNVGFGSSFIFNLLSSLCKNSFVFR
jgi:hypothetical protein